MNRQDFLQKIDHTLLKPDATRGQVEQTILYARENKTASVCLHSSYVPMAAELLKGTQVAVCTVVGFPSGAVSTYGKVKETEKAWEDGAQEIDMVLHLGAMKSGDYHYVLEDIKAVKNASGALLKVIFENCCLSEQEIINACGLCVEAGADFVKTSTGFGLSGATVHDVALMRAHIPPAMGLKAAGGIADLSSALSMLQAGATRLGSSRTAALLEEFDKRASDASL